jgi:integrase
MAIRSRKLASGRRVYDVMLRRPDGTQYSSTFRTKKEAEAWEAQQKADRSRHRWVDPTAGRVPFRTYATEWLRTRPGLSPRTISTYRSQLTCHLLPGFGDRLLCDISTRDVRVWHAKVAKDTSSITAAKCYRMLATIMNTAVADGLLLVSPCTVKGAGKEESESRWLPPVELALDLADRIEPRYRLFVLLAAFCGLRMGELQGLTRRDLDLEVGTVAVWRQLQELDAGQGLTVMDPKSRAGKRTVSMPAAVAAEAKVHLDTWAEAGPDGAAFVGPNGGRRRATIYKAWRAALPPGAPADLHPHDLRHLANTLAARVPGTTSKDLMRRIGHDSEKASLRYLHASPEADAAIAAGLDGIIRAARSAAGGSGLDPPPNGAEASP